MVPARYAVAASRLLALLVFAPFGLSLVGGLLPTEFLTLLAAGLPGAPLPESTGILYFTVLPNLLGIVLAIRALQTRTSADAFLLACSTPCLVGGPWTVYQHYFVTHPHSVVFPVWSALAGMGFAGLVLLDAVMDARDAVRDSGWTTDV